MLATASLTSRALGLVRDRVLATGFGAGRELDIYYAAFRIPDFLFNILIWGAISSAFIPIFAGYVAAKKRDESDRVASTILNAALLVLIGVGLLAWVFAPQLTPLVAPGFAPDQQAEVAELTRIMLLSPLFFGLSGIFGSILNTHQRFLAYAVAPLFYNLGIIGGALVAPQLGLKWLAIGVVIGAFLQMMVQLIAVARTGFRYRWSLELSHPGVRRIFALMVPTTIGVAILQVNLLLETIIASTLWDGALAQFMLATSLSMLPVGVVGASFATAVFPVLARAASQKRTDVFVSNLVDVIRKILYFVIPMSIGMMLLRAQIVRIIYGAGKFDAGDTRYVTSLVGILALSLFAQALIPLLTRAFYSLRNTRIPVVISGICMVLNIGAALILTRFFGVVGLAEAFSGACIIQVALLFFFLSAKVPAIEDQAMISAITRIVIASLVMGAAVFGTLYVFSWMFGELQNTQTLLFFVLQTVSAVLIGGITYLWLTAIWKLPEAHGLLRRFRRRSRAV